MRVEPDRVTPTPQTAAPTTASPTPGAPPASVQADPGSWRSFTAPRAKPVRVAQASTKKKALAGLTARRLVTGSIAGKVDAAFLESTKLHRYIDDKITGPKALKVKGRLSVEDKAVYAAKYAKHVKAKGGSAIDAAEHQKQTAGFFDPKTGKITLKYGRANVESAVHEGIHMLADDAFRKRFGPGLDEGATAYFTDVVLKEQGLGKGRAYKPQKKVVEALVREVGFHAVACAYFRGDTKELFDALIAKKGKDVAMKFNIAIGKRDWDEALRLLK